MAQSEARRALCLLAALLSVFGPATTFYCLVSGISPTEAASGAPQVAPLAVGGGAPLWLSVRELPRAPSDQLRARIQRVGPNMRASANYYDYTDVGLGESQEAWRLLHEQARQLAQERVQSSRAQLEALVRDSNVSLACRRSVSGALDSMEQFDSWALEMWSATGNFPPAGFVSGVVTDLGSYSGCLNIGGGRRQASAQEPLTSYCLVTFRPIQPRRPNFHSIFKQIDQSLINAFNESNFMHTIASRAQYYYYVYLKTGVCVPYACTPGDVQRVSGAVAAKFALMSGPVKCFARIRRPTNQADEHSAVALEGRDDLTPYLRHEQEEISIGHIENEPILIQIDQGPNRSQLVAIIMIGAFFSLVFIATLWHACELALIKLGEQRDDTTGQNDDLTKMKKIPIGVQQKTFPKADDANHHLRRGGGGGGGGDDNDVQMCATPDPKRRRPSMLVRQSSGLRYVAFNYLSMITNGQEFLNTSLRSHEIKCLHGIRVITMLWIIAVHTLQYNEWSEFTKIYGIERTLTNPLLQPLINANYVVDNFFLMSGLLVAYTTWFSNKGTVKNYNITTSLLGRYLRLTPQALLVSLLYILLPLVASGPFWYDTVHDAAKFCEKNWWVNLLHLQAFYRDNEICNLVGWWISVDMMFYVIATVLVWMILSDKVTMALICTIAVVVQCTVKAAYRHYSHNLTPNNLGNVPQIGEVWSEYVVKFNWSPYSHAYVFFLGLWIGYALATNRAKNFIRRWSRLGWVVSLFSLFLVNFSSHIWISGAYEPNNQLVSTTYNILCTIIWANAFGWIIAALHYGSFPWLSVLLSTDICVLLSKASFIIYLSHMLLIRYVFGIQDNTIEVSNLNLFFLMIGNTTISIAFGVFLCIAFEGPCMKFQRCIINKIKPNTRETQVAVVNNESFKHCGKSTLDSGPTTVALLK